jgi:flavodoxin
MTAVVYASRGGNTKKLADAAANAAGMAALSVNGMKDALEFGEPMDLLFVGGSLYAGKIDGSLRKFLQNLDSAKVKRVAVFGSAAGKKSALAEVKSILSPKGVDVADEAFQCRGSFLFANSGHPDADDLKAVADFVKRILNL